MVDFLVLVVVVVPFEVNVWVDVQPTVARIASRPVSKDANASSGSPRWTHGRHRRRVR